MATSRSTYKHRALSSDRSIRILKLQPSRRFSSQIVCDLEDVSFFDVPEFSEFPDGPKRSGLGAGTPPYEALSYVWGYTTGDHEITCDGAPLLVTSNCLDALRHFRLRRNVRRLWVDAICIDQSSLPERNQQVRMMGTIYASAQKVLIWLGIATKHSNNAMRNMKFAGVYMRTAEWMAKKRPAANKIAETLRLMSGKLPDTVLQWFVDEVPQQWFSRVWTLQELVLASKAILICGRHTVRWDHFAVHLDDRHSTKHRAFALCLNAVYIRLQFEQVQRGKLLAYRWSIMQHMPDLENTVRDLHKVAVKFEARIDDVKSSLSFYLLDSARLRSASEPRDRVFGLQAVLAELGVGTAAIDYSAAVSQIYEDFMFSMIRRTNNLVPLTYLAWPSAVPDGPSWVPDLSAEGRDMTVDAVSVQPANFRAWQFRLSFALSRTRGKLILEAILLSHIRHVNISKVDNDESTILVDDRLSMERIQPIAVRLLQALQLRQSERESLLPGAQNFVSTLWVATLLDDEDGSDLLDTDMGGVCALLLRCIMERNGEEAREVATILRLEPGLRSAGTLNDLDIVLQLQHMEFQMFVHGYKYPIVLANGCIGWSRSMPQEGDQVYLCFGSSKPILLRPEGNSFTYIGPCKVAGIPSNLRPLDVETDYDNVEMITLV